jgi:hypothetical protein
MPVEIQQNEWNLAMRRGDFEAAWHVTDRLEARRRSAPPTRDNLLWNGDDPTDRSVSVRCLHGLGDTIQFSRFLPLLNARAAELSVFVQPELVSLFKQQRRFGVIKDASTEWEDSRATIEVEIMELGYLFRVTTSSVPAPCLRVSSAVNQHHCLLTSSIQRSRKVAIFWASSGWGGGRYIPLKFFDQLAGLDNVEFFSFQQGAVEQETATSALPIHRLAWRTRRIIDLARALVQMDVVLSVDTMAAHLAGSLRVPVCLLLEPPADWRWIEGRSDSPWYPQMSVFPRRHQWSQVINEVSDRLKLMFESRPLPKACSGSRP